MAAIVQIHEMTASRSGEDRTGDQVRFYSTDTTATGSTSNPITIPTTGSDWSYTKQLRFYIGGTGPSNYIASLEFYTDGTSWGNDATKVLVEYDKSATTFNANVDTPINGVNIFTLTSGNSATLCELTATFSGTNKYIGALLRLQMEVGYEASPGTLSNETITFSYSEQ